MGFKFVRRKLIASTVLGVFYFLGSNIVSEASEIVEVPAYFIAVEEETQETNIYGTCAFGIVDTYIYENSLETEEWIGKLYENSIVTIISVENGWAEIVSGNVYGFVKLEYLSTLNDSRELEEKEAVTWAIIDTDWLNIRVGPGVEYEVADTLSRGTELLKVGETNDTWQMVEIEDEIYYVSKDYIIEETRYSYAKSKEEIDEEIAKQESLENGQNVVDYALQFVGNPYVWGGTDLINGADCSGFVQSVYDYFDIALPRTSYEQRTIGEEVSYSEIQVGDIICYDGHVGIYIGSDQIVNAIGTNYGIGISSAVNKTIVTIRRVI